MSCLHISRKKASCTMTTHVYILALPAAHHHLRKSYQTNQHSTLTRLFSRATLLFSTTINVLTCQGCTCELPTSYRWALSFEHVTDITSVKQTALLVLCSFSSMSHHTRHNKAVILYRDTNEQQHWRPATSQRSITKVAGEPHRRFCILHVLRRHFDTNISPSFPRSTHVDCFITLFHQP